MQGIITFESAKPSHLTIPGLNSNQGKVKQREANRM